MEVMTFVVPCLFGLEGQEQKELDVELPVPEKFHRQSSAL